MAILYGEKIKLPDESLPEIFKTLLRSHPNLINKIALIDVSNSATFLEVDQISDRVSSKLSFYKNDQPASGNGPPCVGLFMSPGVNRTIAFLSILKSGFASLPLDVDLPLKRLELILADARPVCILTDQRYLDCLNEESRASFKLLAPFIEYNSIVNDDVANQTEYDFPADTIGTILYTSGTTSAPKAVLLSHKTILNSVWWGLREYVADQNSVFATILGVRSVAYLLETLLPLLHGYPQLILPTEAKKNPLYLLELLQKFDVTHLTVVPPTLLENILHSISSTHSDMPTLIVVGTGSEVLPAKTVETFWKVLPKATLVQIWGMTETSCYTAAGVYSSVFTGNLMDNRAAFDRVTPNTNMYILRDDDTLAEDDELGHVALSGYNLFSKYKGISCQKTFTENPYSKEGEHNRLFKTGDFGKVINGKLIFEGRQQNIVKRHGHKVSTTEIEAVIASLPEIRQAPVFGSVGKHGTNLVCFYLAKDDAKVTDTAILDHCRSHLPDYAVPTVFRVDSLPRRPPTDKIDYPALQEQYKLLVSKSIRDNKDMEKTDGGLWPIIKVEIAETLNVPTDHINLDSNLTELGCNSVGIFLMLEKLKALGIKITLEDALRATQVKDLVGEEMRKYLQFEGESKKINLSKQLSLYQIVPLAEKHVKKVDEIFQNVYPTQHPGFRSMRQNYGTQFNFNVSKACDLGISAVAVDEATREIAGCCVCSETPPWENRSFPPAGKALYLIICTDEYLERAKRDGRVLTLHYFASNPDLQLPESTVMMLAKQMTEWVMEKARERGYRRLQGVFIPATAKLMLHMGFEVIGSTYPYNFTFEGKNPFSDVDPEYHITLLTFKL